MERIEEAQKECPESNLHRDHPLTNSSAGRGNQEKEERANNRGMKGNPAYQALYRSGELESRVEAAKAILKSCQLCPRDKCPGRKAAYDNNLAKEYGILK